MTPRILIVEDNKSDVVLFQEALRVHGVLHEVVSIEDGDAAIRYLLDLPGVGALPALIVLDLNLPKRDGIEVLTAIRGSELLRDVPVAILTTSDSPAEQEKAAALGISAYMRKPVGLDRFLALGAEIKRLLSGAVRPGNA